MDSSEDFKEVTCVCLIITGKKIMSSPKVPADIAAGVAGFDKTTLKHSETEEKNQLPDQGVINQEKTIQNIEGFDSTKLKHAQTTEKNTLPNQADVTAEKEHLQHKKSIESFDKSKMQHTQTQEKNVLPDPASIAAVAEHESRLHA